MAGQTEFAAPLDIRFVGAIGGRYSLARAAGYDPGRNDVQACRTVSLSTTSIVLSVPVVAPRGRQIVLMLDKIGLIKGTISSAGKSGLHVAIVATLAEREKLAAKINWLKKHRLNQADDKRTAQRWHPRNPRGVFSLGDGSESPCVIVDVSVTGAAVSARVVPPVGTAVTLGAVAGIVVRHTETGFGIRFQSIQEQTAVEVGIGMRRSAAV